MFIVVNCGTSGSSTAYQVAYAYNSRELKGRKFESESWSPWA